MQVSVIEKFNPGEVSPTEHLSALVEKYQGSWGFAFIKDGQFFTASEGTKCDLEQLQEIMTNTLDEHRILFMSQAANELQPYNLVPKPGEPDEALVLGFLAGHFFNATPAGSTDSNENVLATTWLAPKLQKTIGFLNGDVGKLMAEIADVSNELDYHGRIDSSGGGGTIMVVGVNGEHATFSSKGCIHSYPWGITTDPVGLEVKTEVAPVEAKPSTMDKFKKVTAKAIASVTPLKKEATRVEDAATEMVAWKPAKNSTTDWTKNAYKALTGTVPGNWDQHPEIMVSKQRLDYCVMQKWNFNKIRSFKDLAGLKGTMQVDAPPPALPPEAEPPVAEPEKKKDVEPKTVTPAAAKPTGATMPEAGPRLPILSENEIKSILDGPILKTLDKNSLVIDDPKKLAGLEEKFPTLWSQLGQEEHNPVYTYEALVGLQKLHPEAVTIMCFHALINCRKAEIAAEATTSHIAELQRKLHETGVGVLKDKKPNAMDAFGRKKTA